MSSNPFEEVGRDPAVAGPGSGNALVGPPAQEVINFHRNSDLDSAWNAQHHTIGTKKNQAADGKVVADLTESTIKKSQNGIHVRVLGTAQTIANGTWTKLENWDGDAAVASTPGLEYLGGGVFEIEILGWYRLKFQGSFNPSSAGSMRAARISYNNGVIILSRKNHPIANAPHNTDVGCEWVGILNPGNTIQFEVWHDIGSNLNVVSGEGQSSCSLERLPLN